MALQLLLPTIYVGEDRSHYDPTVNFGDMKGVDVSGFNGYTIVMKIRKSENHFSGSKVKLVLEAPKNRNCTLSAVWIGRVATSGDAWDFASSPAAVRATFNGSNNVQLAQGKTYMSDPINFAFDASKNHIIAIDVTSDYIRRYTEPAVAGVASGVISYYKAAVSEAGTTNKGSGYTAQQDTAYAVRAVRVLRTED